MNRLRSIPDKIRLGWMGNALGGLFVLGLIGLGIMAMTLLIQYIPLVLSTGTGSNPEVPQASMTVAPGQYLASGLWYCGHPDVNVIVVQNIYGPDPGANRYLYLQIDDRTRRDGGQGIQSDVITTPGGKTIWLDSIVFDSTGRITCRVNESVQ